MRKKAAARVACVVAGLLGSLRGGDARAFVTAVPASLAPEVLSETVPTAFAPFDLAAEDYVVEWDGRPVEGVELSIASGTLQWVRVSDVLVLPRARLSVRARGAHGGRVSNAGFSQALEPAAGTPAGALAAELPVALISGGRNPVEVVVRRGGQELSGRALLRFRPRPALGPGRVHLDPSCSRFGMSAEGIAAGPSGSGWVYVGCRFTEALSTGYRSSVLEAWVYWDGVGQEILVGGVRTPSSSVSLWPLRLRAEPGAVSLAVAPGGAGGSVEDLKLRYSFAPRLRHLSLGLGLGPYNYHFEGNGEDDTRVTAIPMLYGSYFVTEAMRLVAFGVFPVSPQLVTDLGLYVNTEYLRVLDRRLVANIMLGAHFIGFRSGGRYNFKFGLPQGLEISYIDAFRTGCNLTAGTFFYPLINGKLYYNTWLRWGSGKFFGEFNYIAWGERVGEEDVRSRSAGVSFGFPLGKFF